MAETIGERIRRERLRHDWTQRELADKVRVGVPHISKIEAGRESASDDLIERLARALTVDADELFIVARRLPERMVEALASDPARAVAFLRKWKPHGHKRL